MMYDVIGGIIRSTVQQYQTVILDTPEKLAEHERRDGCTYRLGDTVRIPIPAAFVPMPIADNPFESIAASRRVEERYKYLRDGGGRYGISNSGIYDYLTGEDADKAIDDDIAQRRANHPLALDMQATRSDG